MFSSSLAAGIHKKNTQHNTNLKSITSKDKRNHRGSPEIEFEIAP